MRIRHTALLALVACAVALDLARAELPLPDATFYGKLVDAQGAAVTTGDIRGVVQRGGAALFTAMGEFRSGDGDTWYVLKIPMETAIGAPGPSGAGARAGDAFAELFLDGQPVTLAAAPVTLEAGSATRVDGTVDVSSLPRFIRGDCTQDLKLDISDAVGLLGYLFLGAAEPRCFDACDGHDNGILELTDAVFLLQHLFLGGEAPPPPGPTCDEDPAGGVLGCASPACD